MILFNNLNKLIGYQSSLSSFHRHKAPAQRIRYPV